MRSSTELNPSQARIYVRFWLRECEEEDTRIFFEISGVILAFPVSAMLHHRCGFLDAYGKRRSVNVQQDGRCRLTLFFSLVVDGVTCNSIKNPPISRDLWIGVLTNRGIFFINMLKIAYICDLWTIFNRKRIFANFI